MSAGAPPQTPLVELTELPEKLLFGFQKFLFRQLNAPYSSKMRQTRNIFGVRGQAPCRPPFIELYLTGLTLSQKILWIWNICINYIAPRAFHFIL